ncbi:MAG: STAS-like domain-containing protein [Gammaproteobacteria bacterium]
MRLTDIKQFILKSVEQHRADIVAVTSKKFSVTRTTVHRHLKSLIAQGKIVQSGTTKNTLYFSSDSFARRFTFKVTSALDEFQLYIECIESLVSSFPVNVQDIVNYCFTELVNNVLDHARATQFYVETSLEKNLLSLKITDNGIGVFKNIYDYFQLDDLRESILQLSKGKMTTAPEHHTGEGLFFSSKITEFFHIYANNFHYYIDNQEHDWSLEEDKVIKQGTMVHCIIDVATKRKLLDVFKKYQDENDFSFNRTDILVILSKLKEETLISRSQAKRVLRGLENFKHITLDFTGVRLVGQGFVDQVFRVFHQTYPHIKLNYTNANKDIDFMIKRSLKLTQG